MKTDPLKQFVAIKSALVSERTRLESRLAEINRALELSAPPKATPRADNSMSLREAIAQVTKDKPLTKAQILAAIQKLGYKFTARDPMNSLNVTLYSGNFKNCGDGKFQAKK